MRIFLSDEPATQTGGSARSRPGSRPPGIALLLALLVFGLLPGLVSASLVRLEQAVKDKPEDLRLRYLLGRRFAESGQHGRAVKEFEEVLRQRSRVPVVLFHLGLAHARLGNLTQAVLSWTRILEEKPNNTKTMGYLGLALYRQGLGSPSEELRQRLFEESLDWWNRILRLEPTNLRARYFAGIELFKLGRYEDAARHWLIFLRVRRNHPKVLGLVAKALLKLGKTAEARRTLVQLEKLGAETKDPKVLELARKTLAELVAAERSGSPAPNPDLDEDETSRDAVTRDPEEIRPLPPGPEPPPPPPLGPRPTPPSVPVDEPVTLQAETLFLDGLDYKEQGNFEKALFSFLQALDLQPDFSQVYLQIGEVYLGLARLAPTPTEFEKRLDLAENALAKVKDLSPNTLLAHAAHSKLAVARRSKSLGFQGYHEELAKQAVAEKRESDAFQEYVVLLSNSDFRPAVFLQLAGLIPRLTEGNQQDLRFFLEELRDGHPGVAMLEYLLGRVYLARYLLSIERKEKPDPDLATMARTHLDASLEGMQPRSEERTQFLGFLEASEADPVDHFLAARVLARDREAAKALEHVTTFLKAAHKQHPYFQDASQLKEQISISIRPATSGAASQKTLDDEIRLLRETAAETAVFFDRDDEGAPLLSPGHLLDDRIFQALRLFADAHPAHGLSRFLLGWVLRRRAESPQHTGEADRLRTEGRALWERSHREHLADAVYHHRLGLACLAWSLADPELQAQAEIFFRSARQIRLSFGITRSGALAEDCLKQASGWRQRARNDLALILLEEARRFDPESLTFHAERFQLELARGSLFGALGTLPRWLLDALGHYWIRQILLCDLALILFLTLTVTMLGWSIYLVVRYYAELHHQLTEFWAAKGWLLPLSLTLPVGLLVAFPTGLVVFVPFLAWANMRSRERAAVWILLGGLVVVPLLLPLSLRSNFGMLAAYEQVASGGHTGIVPFLQRELQARGPEPIALHLVALCQLRNGDLEAADGTLQKLSALAPDDETLLVNRGVWAARKGEYETARNLFSKAIGTNPRNARALFDLSAVFRIQGNKERSEQYHRWAVEIASPDVQALIEQLDQIPEEISRLPLLDQPLPPETLDPLFRFFGSRNFLALNATLLGFLTWFLLGGGLAGALLFARERLDIVLLRCHNCQRVLCSLCQQTKANKLFCRNCAEPATRREYLGNEANQELAQEAFRHARFLNFFLPGLGLAFLGWTGVAVCLLMTTTGLLLFRISEGGFLARTVFPELGHGPVDLLLACTLCAALAIYALAQYLLWRHRDEVQPK